MHPITICNDVFALDDAISWKVFQIDNGIIDVFSPLQKRFQSHSDIGVCKSKFFSHQLMNSDTITHLTLAISESS